MQQETIVLLSAGSALLAAAGVGLAVLAGRVRRLEAERIELRQRETRARLFAEQSPVPLCACRETGFPFWTNAAHRALFGIAEDAVQGRSVVACAAVYEQDGCVTCHTTGRHTDGREFPIQLTARRLVLDDGPIVMCSQIDLTSLRKTEAALDNSEREAVLGRLAGRVAHEVNNPLEAIKIYIEPLRNRVQDRPEVAHGLTVIDQQVDRIARLVRGLLGFVRQRALQRAAVNLAEVIHTVVELFQPRFTKKGRTLDLEVPPDLPTAALDADAVQQVLINLLENALVAAPVGGWVGITAAVPEPGLLRIAVSDNGPGVEGDPEDLFRPFVTTKVDGTGLGLTVARRLCRAHGGDLTAANRPEGGACFTITLRFAAETRP